MRAEFTRKVETLAGDPMLIVMEGQNEQRDLLQAAVNFIIAFGMYGIGLYVMSLPGTPISLTLLCILLLTLGLCTFVLGNWHWRRAMTSSQLIYAARTQNEKKAGNS